MNSLLIDQHPRIKIRQHNQNHGQNNSQRGRIPHVKDAEADAVDEEIERLGCVARPTKGHGQDQVEHADGEEGDEQHQHEDHGAQQRQRDVPEGAPAIGSV